MRLIDADTLIKEINKVYAVQEKEDLMWAKGLHYSKAIIRSMPTIETDKNQQPKTGHWVEKQINSYTRSTTCSECGGSAPFVFVSDDRYGRNGRGKDDLTKYCPNCGAKMET